MPKNRCGIEVEIVENKCIHKGGPHPNQAWAEESDKEFGQIVHVWCKKQMISQQGDGCMYPDYIKDPRCCVCYKEEEPKKKALPDEQNRFSFFEIEEEECPKGGKHKLKTETETLECVAICEKCDQRWIVR